LTENCFLELFRVAGKSIGHDWKFEQGAQAYFDGFHATGARAVERARTAPSGLTNERANALAALRASIPREKDRHER
jgi:hypothetical protein